MTIGSTHAINGETPRWENSGGASNHNEIAPRMADSEDNTIVLSFKYRLLPSRKQHMALEQMLEDQRILYNAALEERISYYRHIGKSRTYMDQCKALTELRQDGEFSSVPANIQRWTLKRLDAAYQAFFRRVKSKGQKAGFPRFRGKGWWHSFGFNEFSGITIKRNRLYFKRMPAGLRVYLHRTLPEGKPLSCTFTRDTKGWAVCVQYRLPVTHVVDTGNQVGVDVGLSHLATLSTAEAIPNPRVAKRAEREMRRRQRALARCKRGSKRRRKIRDAVTRCHARIKNTRRTYLHQVSCRIVRENDLIAVEKLNVKGLAGGMLAKSVHDAGWSILKEMLTYKAAKAGRQLIEVDPRNTTQGCSGCGVIVPKKLSERWHSCPHCGLKLNRDHNAALNVLHRAVLRPRLLNAAQWSERATRNIALPARAK